MAARGAKRQRVVADDCSDDEPDRLRHIVARETRRRLQREAAECTAAAIDARRSTLLAGIDRAVAEQGLTVSDLTEFVDLGSDFAWTAPLSRTRAIEYLARVLSPQPAGERERDQQQQQQQQPQHQQQPQLQLPGDTSRRGPQHPSQQTPPSLCRLSCGPCGVGLDGAPVAEQQQQQQQQPSQQQISSQPSDPHQSHDRQLPASQSQDVDPQPCQSPDAQSLEAATLHFDLAQPTQSFDVASGSSDSSASDADDHDDAYWEAELLGSAAPESPGSAAKRPHSPALETSPAKRKRPG